MAKNYRRVELTLSPDVVKALEALGVMDAGEVSAKSIVRVLHQAAMLKSGEDQRIAGLDQLLELVARRRDRASGFVAECLRHMFMLQYGALLGIAEATNTLGFVSVAAAAERAAADVDVLYLRCPTGE